MLQVGDVTTQCVVFVEEDDIEFSRHLEDVIVRETPSTVTFSCEVPREGLNAKWMKDGEMLPEKPSKYKPYNKHHSYALDINDADENDEGEYSVIIKGKKSSATLSVEVSIRAMRLDQSC